MNIVIVTNSASYEPRAEKIGQYFQKLGYNVLWLESDFIHREKKKGRLPRSNHRYIETVVYKKTYLSGVCTHSTTLHGRYFTF